MRIRSSDGPVIVTAYRFGHYAGVGSRKVWTSQPVTSVTQPAATYTAATRSWSASNWSPSLTLDTTDWPPGTITSCTWHRAGTHWPRGASSR
ncbi:MAG: hypothetical protein IPM00_09240 [Tetrasphaera sp.]|nr:hypothetical protein [Tetrasphaera sp.]